MKLNEIYSTNKTIISYEVFPPKSEPENLLKEIEILSQHNPAFISLTYGAGGGENKSFSLMEMIKDENVSIMPHFTCITSTKENIEENMNKLKQLGIDKILALRGDIPQDKTLMKHDFHHANELVNFLKEKTDLSIGVAGYPEGHIESPDIKTDIENLKKKVDAGADAIFTQLFFDNEFFYDYVNRVRTAEITIPVIAGIMPVISEKQVNKMVSMANISVPKKLQHGLEKYKDKDLIKFGVDFATEQCYDLIKNNVKGLHFYTLDKSYSTNKILENLKYENLL